MDMIKEMPHVVQVGPGTDNTEQLHQLQWCYKNLGVQRLIRDQGVWACYVWPCGTREFYFDSEQDAIRFKLTWT